MDLSRSSFAAPVDDCRADCAFRAWGSRRVRVVDALPGAARDWHQPGLVNPRSVTTMSRIPTTALDVDAICREPQRAAGGWTMIRPFYAQYEYYRHYSNAGCHALSSQHHNFPVGDVPAPSRLYSSEGLSRVTKLRNARPRTYATTGTNTTRTVPSPFYTVGGPPS